MEERERERGENRGKQLSQVLNGERDFRERQRNDTGEPLRMKRPIVRSFRSYFYNSLYPRSLFSLWCGGEESGTVLFLLAAFRERGGEGREARKRRRRR